MSGYLQDHMQDLADSEEMLKLKKEEDRVKEECFDGVAAIAMTEIALIYSKGTEELDHLNWELSQFQNQKDLKKKK